MTGYIDMHCHILPGVDDGAHDISEMKAMLKIAYNDGIRCIIATPHFHPVYGRTSPDMLKKKLSCLRKVAHSIDPHFRIYLGSELFFRQDILTLIKEGTALTMNRRHYLLVEFSPSDSYFHIRQSLQMLQANNYTVILAHVERYTAILENPKLAEELYDMGVHFQINAGSICGKNGWRTKKFIKYLLDSNLVFCVGTDAHNTKDRAPKMKKAAAYITYHYSEEYTRRIFFSNAMQMLKKL